MTEQNISDRLRAIMQANWEEDERAIEGWLVNNYEYELADLEHRMIDAAKNNKNYVILDQDIMKLDMDRLGQRKLAAFHKKLQEGWLDENELEAHLNLSPTNKYSWRISWDRFKK